MQRPAIPAPLAARDGGAAASSRAVEPAEARCRAELDSAIRTSQWYELHTRSHNPRAPDAVTTPPDSAQIAFALSAQAPPAFAAFLSQSCAGSSSPSTRIPTLERNASSSLNHAVAIQH